MTDQSTTITGAAADRLQIEYWPLDRLIPYARNARTHSPAQVAEIAGSIRAFGFSNPILVGEGADIVAGHGRLAAARKLGMTEAPVIVLRGLSDAQRRQLVLADNRIALNAGWDTEMLSLELADLSTIGIDLSILGFSSKELAAVLSSGAGGLTDENQVPLAADVAVSKLGDIWQLGPHRVACGDSTDAGLVQALLVLLRHEFSSSPPCCCGGSAAGTSWQGLDDPPGQSQAHGCDRVGDVSFRPRWRSLWVGNRRVSEVPGTARRNEVLRGESSPVRR